jgi:hypothetical protein
MSNQPPTPAEYARMYGTQREHAAKLLTAEAQFLHEFETRLLQDFRERLETSAAHINGMYGHPERQKARRAEIAAHNRRKRQQQQQQNQERRTA